MKWRTELDLGVAQERCPFVFQVHPSNFKVTRLQKSSILTQTGRFRTVTPVWIQQWLWNDAQSLKQHRRGTLLFVKVIRQISRSRRTKNCRFWPEFSVSGLLLQFDFTNRFEMMHKAWRSIEKCPIVFRGHPSNFTVTQAEKSTIWIQFEITRPVAAIQSLRFALFLIK